jgi:autotransporter-associated beta strand protein
VQSYLIEYSAAFDAISGSRAIVPGNPTRTRTSTGPSRLVWNPPSGIVNDLDIRYQYRVATSVDTRGRPTAYGNWLSVSGGATGRSLPLSAFTLPAGVDNPCNNIVEVRAVYGPLTSPGIGTSAGPLCPAPTIVIPAPTQIGTSEVFAAPVLTRDFNPSERFMAFVSVPENDATLALTTTTGLTPAYGYTAGTFRRGAHELGFIGSYANVNAALEGLRVTRLVAKGAGIPLTVRVTTAPPVDTSGRSYYYFPNNTHYYEFVTGPSISWTAARDAAASRELFGMQGYLVTITSRAESEFVSTQMDAPDIWIGARDPNRNGRWRWVTGPEGLERDGAGALFWINGTTQSGYFSAWASGEPNNANQNGDLESYAAANYECPTSNGVRNCSATSSWNDFVNNPGGRVKSYLIEYGGMPGDTPTLQNADTTRLFGVRPVVTDADVVVFAGESPRGVDWDVIDGKLVTYSTANGTVNINRADLQTALNSGTNRLTSLKANTLSGDQALTIPQTLAFDLAKDSTYSGVISGAGGLIKRGPGNLTLSGANTYTGGTFIEEGSLTAGVSSSAQTPPISGPFGTATISVQPGADLVVPDGTIITNVVLKPVDGPSITIYDPNNPANPPSGVTVGARPADWDVIDGKLVVYQSPLAIPDSAIQAAMNDSNNRLTVIEVGTLSGDGALNIANGQTLTLDVTTNSAYSGKISGDGGLIKDGPGDLTLEGANTYSGGTTILEGKLLAGGGSSTNRFGPGLFRGVVTDSAITVVADGTLGAGVRPTDWDVIDGQLVVFSDPALIPRGALQALITDGTLTLIAGKTFSGDQALVIPANRTLTVDIDANSTYYGTISGDGRLINEGAGLLTLAGNQTIKQAITNADVTISAGAAGSGGVKGTDWDVIDGKLVVYTNPVTIPAADLQPFLTNGTLDTIEVKTIAGDGALNIPNGQTLTIDIDNDSTYGGVISGGGGLIKKGEGDLTLSGDNTYSGGTVVAEGDLIAGNNSTGGPPPTSGPFGTGGITVLPGAELLPGGNTITNVTVSAVVDPVITIFDPNNLPTNSALTPGSSRPTDWDVIDGKLIAYTSPVTISATALQELLDDGTLDSIEAGSLSGDGPLNIPDGQTLTIDVAGDSTYEGDISGGGGLIKEGTGDLTLSGDNTYSGGTTIAEGELTAGGDTSGDPVTNGPFGTGPINVVSPSGNLDPGGFSVTNSARTVITNSAITVVADGAAGAGVRGTDWDVVNGELIVFTDPASIPRGALQAAFESGELSVIRSKTFTGNEPLIIPEGKNITIAIQQNSTYSGVVSGGGGLLTPGPGVLTLSGTSTFKAEITNADVTISASGPGGLKGTDWDVIGGKLVVYTNPLVITQSDLQAAVSASANPLRVIEVRTIAGDGAIEIPNGQTLTIDIDNDSIYSGIISGGGGLIKKGDGDLTLSGANTYSGGTVVTEGELTAGGDATGDPVTSGPFGTGPINTLPDATVSVGTFSVTNSVFPAISNPDVTIYNPTTSALTPGVKGTDWDVIDGKLVVYVSPVNIPADDLQPLLNDGTLDTIEAGTLSGDGPLVIPSSPPGTTTLTLDVSGASTYNGTVSGGGLLITPGNGDLTLSASTVKRAIPDADVVVVADGTAGAGVKGTDWDVIGGKLVIYTNPLNITRSDLQDAVSASANPLTVIEAKTFSGNQPIFLPDKQTLTIDISADSTYSGTITGPGGIIKKGEGVLTLTGNNSYTGGTLLLEGGLPGSTNPVSPFGSGPINEAGGALDDGGFELDNEIRKPNPNADITVVADGTAGAGVRGTDWDVVDGKLIVYTDPLNITKSDLQAAINDPENPLTVIEGGTFSGNQPIVIPDGQTLTIDTSGASTYSGNISGGGGLVKDGTGNLTLSGDNTYSGGTTVAGGDLTAGSDSNLRPLSPETGPFGTGPVNVLPGANVVIPEEFAVNNQVFVAGPKPNITVTSPGGRTRGDGWDVVNGKLIVLDGPDILINRSSLQEALNASVNPLVTIEANTIAGDQSLVIPSGRILTIDIDKDSTYSGIISGGGRLLAAGTGVLTLTVSTVRPELLNADITVVADGTAGAGVRPTDWNVIDGKLIVYTNPVFISQSDLQAAVSDSANPLTIIEGKSFSGNQPFEIPGGQILSIEVSADSTYSGEITGDGRLLTSGEGELVFNNTNNTVKQEFQNADITVVADDADGVGSRPKDWDVINGKLIVYTNPVFISQSGLQAAVSDSANPLTLIEGKTFSGNQPIEIPAGQNLTVNISENSTYSGEITGGGNLVAQGGGILLRSNPGVTVVADDDPLAGDRGVAWDVIDGKLVVFSDPVRIRQSDLQAALDSPTNPLLIIAAGTFTGDQLIVIPSGQSLTIDLDGESEYAGIIGGGGELIKDGPGNLTLSGPNTYGGGTTIRFGTLTAGRDSDPDGESGPFGIGPITLPRNGTLDLNGFTVTNPVIRPRVPSGTPVNTPVRGVVPVGNGATSAVTVTTPAGRVSFEFTGVSVANGAEPEVVVTPIGYTTSDRGILAAGQRFLMNAQSFEFSQVEVCLPVSPTAVASTKATPDRVRLVHTRTDGSEHDVTTTYVATGTAPRVCGVARSFSTFQAVVLAPERIAGSNRYATAAQVAAETHPDGAHLVYVASGTSAADALTAGAVAAAANAPLLLVAHDRVPAATAQALRNLGPTRVVVVGGSTAISATVEAEVRRITGTTVTRIGGADRYETAALLALDRFGDGATTVYVATGQNFPDGVAAGAAAGQHNAALVLVPGSGLPQSVIAALQKMNPERIVVVGGTTAVSAATLTALREFAPQVDRIGGVNRYETATRLTAESDTGRPVILVSGQNFPDAVVAATLARHHGASVLMVATANVPEVTRTRVAALEPSDLIFVGGPRAVTPTVELRLGRLLDAGTPALW